MEEQEVRLRGDTGREGSPTPALNSLLVPLPIPSTSQLPFHYPLQIPLNHTENLFLTFSSSEQSPLDQLADFLLLIFSLRRLQTCPAWGVLPALYAGTPQLEGSRQGGLLSGALGHALTPQGLLCPQAPSPGAGWALASTTQAELLSASPSLFPHLSLGRKRRGDKEKDAHGQA